MGGKLGGEWIYLCVAQSLCCAPETIKTLLIGYTPILNKLKKKIKAEQLGSDPCFTSI